MAEDWSEGWHYSVGADHEGPVSALRLVQLHLKKKVRPDDQVWHPSLTDWCTLREAWPHLRPYKEQALNPTKAPARPKVPAYTVVEVAGGLTPEAVQQAVDEQTGKGRLLAHTIPVDPTRCLLVFRTP